MIAMFLHNVFAIIKFMFGLGALFGLFGIAGLCVWFLGHSITRRLLRGQPVHCYLALRKLFLES